MKVSTKLAGRYRLTKHKADAGGNPIEGTEEQVADWFPNLILDQGLDALGTENTASLLKDTFVGAGSTAPTVSDTSLESLVGTASANPIDSDQGVAQDGSSNWYVYRWETNRFEAGVAEGNLSEVGVGWGSPSELFSRALILDEAGQPTTITVLSDEILDVTYELRIYPPASDYTGTVEIGGETYDYTARARGISSTHFTEGWSISNYRGNSIRSAATVYSGGLGSITGNPSGSTSGSSSVTSLSYTPGSYEASASATWGLSKGNVGGVRSVGMPIGWANWQIEFANQSGGGPVPKDNTRELSFTITHSWARA